jgi:putative transposase
MLEIDKIYLEKPFYWARRIRKELELLWYNITRYKTTELMKIMWIQAIYPKKKTSIANSEHKKYPYLLRNKKITKVNEVWSTDITYIKLAKWWIYLVAVIDWYSRRIISWKLSNTMDISFCIESLKESLEIHKPEIFNTDQWSQFTSDKFTSILEEKWVQISMDWVWRCLDNIYIERFWRSLKYEDIYIKKYENMLEAYKWISEYIEFYNKKRIHQSLDYDYPETVWLSWIQKQKDNC